MSLIKRAESNTSYIKPIITTLDFVLLTIFLLFTANAASFLRSKEFVLIVFVGLFIIFRYKKKKFNRKTVTLWLVWVFINLFSLLVTSTDYFTITTLLGFTLRIMMPFFIVSLIGPGFLYKLNKYIYILVCISTVLYLAGIVFPSLFSSLASSLNFMTEKEQKFVGGFYTFFYMHNVNAVGRNSGFMWEPGGFASVLIIILAYRLSTNNFKIDKYITIYLIALITTYSTAGYLALFFVVFAYIVNSDKNKFFYFIVLLPLFLWFSYSYYQKSDFMANKIEDYSDRGVDTWEYEFDGELTIRVTRLGIAIITLDESVHWPFGFGINKSDYTVEKYGHVEGPNSLAEILHIWGWLGLLYISYVFFWVFRRNVNLSISLLLTTAVFIVLFSNPFHFKYLVYSLVYYHFLYGRKFQYEKLLIK